MNPITLILILSISFLLVMIGYIIAFVIHTKKLKKEVKRKKRIVEKCIAIDKLLVEAMVATN